MRHATLLLLVVLLPALARADGPPPARGDAGYARPLHRLTEVDAYKLNGRRGLFYVRVRFSFGRHDGTTLCVCDTPAGGVAWKTCWLRLGECFDYKMLVEATLHVRRPGSKTEGVEFRLWDAVRK